jgi:hypothetical protein
MYVVAVGAACTYVQSDTVPIGAAPVPQRFRHHTHLSHRLRHRIRPIPYPFVDCSQHNQPNCKFNSNQTIRYYQSNASLLRRALALPHWVLVNVSHSRTSGLFMSVHVRVKVAKRFCSLERQRCIHVTTASVTRGIATVGDAT